MTRRSKKATIVLILTTLLLGACQTKDMKLEQAVKFATRRFEQANRDPMYRISLQSTLEMGGTLTGYLAANMPRDRSDSPRYFDGVPREQWSVGILEDHQSGEIVIQGYGDDLTKPRYTARVRLAPLRPD